MEVMNPVSGFSQGKFWPRRTWGASSKRSRDGAKRHGRIETNMEFG